MEQWSFILEKKKREDEAYLFELQKFLDVVSNVESIELKERIVYQKEKCDKRLGELVDEIVRN